MDVTKIISAKSDQQNAENFIGGPRTIKITDVKVLSGQEQPVHISFDGDDGKVWKPCKTALRALAAIWGTNSSAWVGLHCTIYNDPEVTWGGVKTGGIRVSHMEGLTSPRTLMLTKTRGKKGATVIKPLVIDKQPEPTPTPEPEPQHLNTAALDAEIEAAKAMEAEDKAAWWKTKTKPERDYITAKSKAA